MTVMKLRSHLKVTRSFLVSPKSVCQQSLLCFMVSRALTVMHRLFTVGVVCFFSEQQCADLQSDLEDFDLLESDASDCDPKPQFLPEDNEVNPNTELPHMHLAHNPDTLHRKERLSPDCPKLTSVQHQSSSFYLNADLRSTDAKPKIWSIAHTAVSLDASLQSEYPPCMLSSTGTSSSPGYPTNMALTKTERQQESPVATLREWVDGVFHGPPFQQPKPAEVWKGLNEATIESRTPGQSFEIGRSASAL